MSEWTTCGICGRVIYILHSNHGNCVLCDPPAANGYPIMTPFEEDDTEDEAGTESEDNGMEAFDEGHVEDLVRKYRN
jgi:hypothetical protein